MKHSNEYTQIVKLSKQLETETDELKRQEIRDKIWVLQDKIDREDQREYEERHKR